MISTVTSLAGVIPIFVSINPIGTTYGHAQMPLCTQECRTTHADGGTVHLSDSFGCQFSVAAEGSDGETSGVVVY